ncbi:phosphoribosylanthranilate isomerase [Sneathiella marina]|uniref:N-(5'-phosphoribosyl)anthranilate isomerase n=1 Tax=Sneathiella marina TaxID=2950108 RepID=A0ABY4W2M5_9PROT|nr:phosphoribosylanthranilate isomerase [Sneathiella marina]USG61445.1 phosphoribosylanthranilate isomerase [Sneathiella marina]
MSVQGKICGLSDQISVDTAVNNGARFIGLVFYPPSPRNIDPNLASQLVSKIPTNVDKVGLFVDPEDALIKTVLESVKLDWIQLHGSESPDRVRHIRQKFDTRILKAIKISDQSDFEAAKNYENVADMLLFDAKAPKHMANALPGGNGLVFDWRIMQGLEFSIPWMLAGGLTAENVAEAVKISGAKFVDTSSGVEIEPGRKDPAAITAFLTALAVIDS